MLREEVISLCGLADGIRLYNDLHMVIVAPVCTFYVASKDSNEYAALFLEEATTTEFILRLAQSIGVPTSVFRHLYIIGPHGILIRVTDSVVQFTKPESVFQFALRSCPHNPTLPISPGLDSANEEVTRCDVILENTTPTHGVTNEVIMQSHHQQHNHNQGQPRMNSAEVDGGSSEHTRAITLTHGTVRTISPYPRSSVVTEANNVEIANNSSNANHSSNHSF